VAAKSKSAPKSATKTAQSKSGETAAPKAKPADGAVKKLASALVNLVKPGAKSAPEKADDKPAAKAAAKPAEVKKAADKPAAKSSSAKSPSAAAAKTTSKPAAQAESATPAPAAAKTAAAGKKPAAQPKAGESMAPAIAATASIPAEGLKARAVKPSKPVNTNEVPPIVVPTRVDLPEGYRPSPDEEYMNPNHLEYFRRKLMAWRAELVEESKQTIDNLREEVRDVGDEAERATRETENSLELRTRDRYRKLIGKIDKALKRIDDGVYGYCEETGEEIGIERLEARPIATLCLDAQERWEHRQRLMGD